MTSAIPLRLQRLCVRLEPGRRGTDVCVTGSLILPGKTMIDETRLYMAAMDDADTILAVEDGRMDAELALNGELIFRQHLRLPASVAARIARVQIWCTTIIEEVAASWTTPAAALPPPEPGRRSFWHGAAGSVARGPVESDGDVNVYISARCPLDAAHTYDRDGRVHLTIVDGQDRVCFHDDTSFSTMGGQLGPSAFSERIYVQSPALTNAHEFRFSLFVKRYASSPAVLVSSGDFFVDPEDD